MQIAATFYRYFFIRFFKYLLAINLFFVFLFNFIEFFEKLSRAKYSSVHEILYFLALNIAPTFFEQLPISAWLTSCLLIRELHIQQELDALVLLSVSLRKIFILFFTVGCMLACVSLIINEGFVTKLTFKAEQYKMEHFKQISTRRLVNKWFALEPEDGATPEAFCYFSVLNPQQPGEMQQGKDLFLLYTQPKEQGRGGEGYSFVIQKMLSASIFFLDTQKQKIFCPELKTFDVERNTQTKIENYALHSPSFFSQLNLNYEPPTLLYLGKTLFCGHKLIPPAVNNELWGQLFKRIALYMLLILYPMLTFGLFAFFWWRVTLRWVAIFTPYLVFTMTSFLADHMMHAGVHATIAFSPYVFLALGTFMLYRNLR